MSNWNALTSDDVKNRLTKPELTALLGAARQVEQTPEGILADAISTVTSEVRGYVAGCARNQLGAEGTIPDELASSALALLRRYLFTRLPNMKPLYDDIRQTETKDALDRLRDTAAGKFAIVPPEAPAPATEQASGGSPSITPKTRRFGSEDGV
jgi:hypothetical protein